MLASIMKPLSVYTMNHAHPVLTISPWTRFNLLVNFNPWVISSLWTKLSIKWVYLAHACIHYQTSVCVHNEPCSSCACPWTRFNPLAKFNPWVISSLWTKLSMNECTLPMLASIIKPYLYKMNHAHPVLILVHGQDLTYWLNLTHGLYLVCGPK